MGLIKAAIGGLGGVLADQWKEYFICDALSDDVLMVKGQKRVSGRSSNTKGSENVISSGSVIVVADGQCVLIVEQGKIVEVCAEPGEFVFDASTEPSIFSGDLGDSIVETFKNIGKRFTFGGEAPKDQRVYYINTKEFVNNKFGTPTPIAFRVVDSRLNFDMDVSLRCNGTYSFRITNPLLFYTKVCGNAASEYSRDALKDTMRTEFIDALGPAIGQLSALELRPNQILSHMKELKDSINRELDDTWGQLRGMEVVNIAMNPPSLTEEDAGKLQDMQEAASMASNPALMAARMATAQNEAMVAAAKNSAGAMTGFMGMGMAQSNGGNIADLMQMGQAQQAQQKSQSSADTWQCACGTTVQGNFCPECGKKKPEAGWKCSCGSVNSGNFCPECGKKKPDAEWTCSCGAGNKGNFCSQCGAKKP